MVRSKPAATGHRWAEGSTERRNPGVPLDMGWVNEAPSNRGAVERWAATKVTRRMVDWLRTPAPYAVEAGHDRNASLDADVNVRRQARVPGSERWSH
jgi:hypothetical protein